MMRESGNILTLIKDSIEIRNPITLKHHPVNQKIYGSSENISDFIKKIEKSGRIDPLIITSDNYVISGNRRLDACIQLKKKEIPVIVKTFKDYEDEVICLIKSNVCRQKTNEQRVREGIELENIYIQKKIIQETDIYDSIIENIGLKSKRQFERWKRIVKYIDEIRNVISKQYLEMFVKLFNEAPSTAEEFMSKIDIKNLDKEIVEDIIMGRKTAYSLIQETKDRNIFNKAMTSVETEVYEYNAQSLGILPMGKVNVRYDEVVKKIEKITSDFNNSFTQILITQTSAPEFCNEEKLYLNNLFYNFKENLEKNIKNLLYKGV